MMWPGAKCESGSVSWLSKRTETFGLRTLEELQGTGVSWSVGGASYNKI
jgi:hypothetical protein